MDQQQEQRKGKGGVRERGEELQKKREQSWWQAAEHQAGVTGITELPR